MSEGQCHTLLLNLCVESYPVQELVSGVDAVYLSARSNLSAPLVDRLHEARQRAQVLEAPVDFEFGGTNFRVQPFGVLKYRFRLDHANGLIGVSPGGHLPTFFVQPRAEFIHALGPGQAVAWFRGLLEAECHFVQLSVRRADLFADFQGLTITGDDRHRFVSRAKKRTTDEDDETFNGLRFGRRSTGTICARIYDKTIELEESKAFYWREMWGDYDPTRPVVRVEFELGREALRQFAITTPEQFLDAVGALWVHLTDEWLSLRIRTDDQTKSRWPVDPSWQTVRRASIAWTDWGIYRLYKAQRAGELAHLMPGLVGYLSSFGALTNAEELEAILDRLFIEADSWIDASGLPMIDRVANKRKSWGAA